MLHTVNICQSSVVQCSLLERLWKNDSDSQTGQVVWQQITWMSSLSPIPGIRVTIRVHPSHNPFVRVLRFSKICQFAPLRHTVTYSGLLSKRFWKRLKSNLTLTPKQGPGSHSAKVNRKHRYFRNIYVEIMKLQSVLEAPSRWSWAMQLALDRLPGASSRPHVGMRCVLHGLPGHSWSPSWTMWIHVMTSLGPWTLPGLLYPLASSCIWHSVASCVCKLAQREAIIDLSKWSLIQTPRSLRSLRSPRSLPGAPKSIWKYLKLRCTLCLKGPKSTSRMSSGLYSGLATQKQQLECKVLIDSGSQERLCLESSLIRSRIKSVLSCAH